MTKMAAMLIYGKTLLLSSSPDSIKLGMQYLGLLLIIVYSNDDPGLTFTYFTARSNLETFAFL